VLAPVAAGGQNFSKSTRICELFVAEIKLALFLLWRHRANFAGLLKP
jgi:hypothetical protein